MLVVKPGEMLSIALTAVLLAIVVGVLAFDAGYNAGRCEEYAAAHGLAVVEVNYHDGSCVGRAVTPSPEPIRFIPVAPGKRVIVEPESQEPP